MRMCQYAAFFFSENLRSEKNQDKNYFDFKFISSNIPGFISLHKFTPRANFILEKAPAHHSLCDHVQQNPENPKAKEHSEAAGVLHVPAVPTVLPGVLLHRQLTEHPQCDLQRNILGRKNHRLQEPQGRVGRAEVSG